MIFFLSEYFGCYFFSKNGIKSLSFQKKKKKKKKNTTLDPLWQNFLDPCMQSIQFLSFILSFHFSLHTYPKKSVSFLLFALPILVRDCCAQSLEDMMQILSVRKILMLAEWILLNKCWKYLVLPFINAPRKWGENKRMITEPCDKNCRTVQRTYLSMCPLEMKEIGIIIYLQRESNYAGFRAKPLSVIFSGQ